MSSRSCFVAGNERVDGGCKIGEAEMRRFLKGKEETRKGIEMGRKGNETRFWFVLQIGYIFPILL